MGLFVKFIYCAITRVGHMHKSFRVLIKQHLQNMGYIVCICGIFPVVLYNFDGFPILHVPEKYKNWVENLSAPVTGRMVGFVDFAPTVINLAGAEIPDMMEGRNFLGEKSEPKKYIFGYRDRADDCYDMSRSVTDGRY